MAMSAKQNRHLPAFLLLFLLDGPKHGGALFSLVQETLQLVESLDSGAIYRTLRDLEQKHCVLSSWNTEESGPAKKVYSITGEGLSELQLWRDEMALRKKNLDFFLERYQLHSGIDD